MKFIIILSLFYTSTCSASTTDNPKFDGQSHGLHDGHGDKGMSSRVRRTGREVPFPSRGVAGQPAPYKIDGLVPRQGQNLKKPKFLECLNYSPRIFEEQVEGIGVIQVFAQDSDLPEFGGNVTYSILSRDETYDIFTIDPFTGHVTTKKVFDRDEPSREKEVYVTVRATDNGTPQLDDVCTIKVRILDINDNQPMFDKYEYKETVPRDLALNEVVVRISATDIDDGNNGTIQYKLERHPESPLDMDYFDIFPHNGQVILKRNIPADKWQFLLRAVAQDKGSPIKSTSTDLSIKVTEPNLKPPTFIEDFPKQVSLPERTADKSKPILIIKALSNTEDGNIFFELVNGQTQPTNKDAVFILEPGSANTIANLKLDKQLDYESVSEYTLTIRAYNKYNLASEVMIIVKVLDENDEKPMFTEVNSGSVLENELPGTSVLRVRAIDTDGTFPNNDVTYFLRDEDKENFEINPQTGEITTRTQFDREEQNTYQVVVFARDGAPSALTNNGAPNERTLTLKINIADKNDNEPTFVKTQDEVEVPEDSNLNSKVIIVKAVDKDTASILDYSIVAGNVDDTFYIESTSSFGVVRIKKRLDYEKTTKYELIIGVSDRVFEDRTKVTIHVTNINDERPIFEEMNSKITIFEESIPDQCIFMLKAYDPDIKDRSLFQNISYFVDTKYAQHFSVNNNGCVRVQKPLDRDIETGGYPMWQFIVGAFDEGGLAPTKLHNFKDLTIILTDINDNAPVLNFTNKVVWDENQDRGLIVHLTAKDADLPENGPPFQYSIDPAADNEIRTLFSVRGDLFNAEHDNFNREKRKEYLVPIIISDNGQSPKTGTAILTVIIGDKNDNPMKDGESKISVYKYKEKNMFNIGRVYVEDPDDWDLPDKTFTAVSIPNNFFNLDVDNGNINMRPITPEGIYTLKFKVYDRQHNQEVKATVNVTVKQITEEALDNSGSIRFFGITKEQFIIQERENSKSKIDILREIIAGYFHIDEEDVDIFTVFSNTANVLDVRYSVYGPRYYKAGKLDTTAAEFKDRIENALKLDIVMIPIDECLRESVNCESSCTNELRKEEISYKIFTNQTSLVGVNAYVEPECICASELRIRRSCIPNPCLNEGICLSDGRWPSHECECTEGFEGPYCEKTSIAFTTGKGWAWYEPLSVCNDSMLQVEVTTIQKNALILYNGPIYKSPLDITDFVSVELRDGRPLLLIDLGSGVSKVQMPSKSQSFNDGQTRLITARWNPQEISLQVGDCTRREPICFQSAPRRGTQRFLNVNGPLQVGGFSFDPRKLQILNNWEHVPTAEPFIGVISNLPFNGKYYNLGDPVNDVSSNICYKRDNFGEIWVGSIGKETIKKCPVNQTGNGRFWFCTNGAVFETEQPQYECAPHWIGNIEDDFKDSINNSNDGTLKPEQVEKFLATIDQKLNSVVDYPTLENENVYYGPQIEDILNLVEAISMSLNCKYEEQSNLENLAELSLNVNAHVLNFEKPWAQIDMKNRSRQFSKLIANFESTWDNLLISRLNKNQNYRKFLSINNTIELMTGLEMDLESRDYLFFPENPDLGHESYIELPRGWQNYYEFNSGENLTCKPRTENPKFSGIKIPSNLYKNKLPNFLDDGVTKKYLNGPMLAFSFLPLQTIQDFEQSGRIKIQFKHDGRATKSSFSGGTFNRKEISCVYWDPKNLIWSTSGCHLIENESNGLFSVCECNHLTSFALLMGKHEKDDLLVIISILLSSISNIFLVITAFILDTTKELQNTQGDISKIICILLFLGNFLIVFMNPGIYREVSHGLCMVTGIATHFIFLTLWVWMGLLGLHLFKLVVFPFNIQENRLGMIYKIVGFTIPMILVTGVVGISRFKAYSVGDDDLCWLKGHYIWTFLAPMTWILGFNLTVFLICYQKARQMKKNPIRVARKASTIKQERNVLGWLSLSISLGLTWLPGYFLMIDPTPISAYIFTILNGSQGFFIFIFHFILKEKFKGALFKMTMNIASSQSNLNTGISTNPKYTKVLANFK